MPETLYSLSLEKPYSDLQLVLQGVQTALMFANLLPRRAGQKNVAPYWLRTSNPADSLRLICTIDTVLCARVI